MALEQTLAADPPPAVRLHPNLARVYRAKVERLHLALADLGAARRGPLDPAG
jgi:hypothetical protein